MGKKLLIQEKSGLMKRQNNVIRKGMLMRKHSKKAYPQKRQTNAIRKGMLMRKHSKKADPERG